MTVGENIADNVGLKQSYRAYVQWERRQGPEREPRLPGLPYSPRQMFWLSAANVWCEKIRHESLKMQIMSDNHPPSRFRINGPFGNLPDFSRDYRCAPGTKMNPPQRCSVW